MTRAFIRRLPGLAAKVGAAAILLGLAWIGYNLAIQERDLGYDYARYRIDGEAVIIRRSTREIIVGADIASYEIDGQYVTGHVRPAHFPEHGTPGFFILNMSTGELEIGMSSAQFQAVLDRLGLKTTLRR